MNSLQTSWNRRAARWLGATLFVALAGASVLTAEAAPDGAREHRHGDAGPMGAPFMGGRHAARMLDAVQATPEQRSQIAQIMQAAHADLQAQREAGRGVHEQLRQAFTQPAVDANVVESLRLQLLSQHDQASQRMMRAMLEASRVLTPEQRAQLADLASQRRAKRGHRAPPP
jgi:periplasmic protein CpxP/Spy